MIVIVIIIIIAVLSTRSLSAISTEEGSESDEGDYIALSNVELVFDVDERYIRIKIELINDNESEYTESFQFLLHPTTNCRICIALVMIMDDDAEGTGKSNSYI